jgi:Cyclic nucleotide-binding domain
VSASGHQDISSTQPRTGADEPAIAEFIRGLLERAKMIRLGSLLEGRSDALYQKIDRRGITTVAVKTPSLTTYELEALLQYRLAQYLIVGFLNPIKVYEARLQHEPVSAVTADDVHILSINADSGELLCCLALRAVLGATDKMTLRTDERPMVQTEEIHGLGIFNRLRLLPDLPLKRVREAGRFVKNQQIDKHQELMFRAPVEAGAAFVRILVDSLRLEVEAVVGEFETDVAKRNLDYFHVPLVFLRGTVPHIPEDSIFFPRFHTRPVYPWAFSCRDLDLVRLRLAKIEAALGLPRHDGLLALLEMRGDPAPERSRFEPIGGLPPLSDVDFPQPELPMPVRAEMRRVGALVRTTESFGDLSVAEATVLGTFMERIEVGANDTVVRQGDLGDDLYLIESGTAEVRLRDRAGNQMPVVTLGPGEYFGEIALMTGNERSADVVALTPMTLMQLSKDAYVRYLSHITNVNRHISHTAAVRKRELHGKD